MNVQLHTPAALPPR